MRRYAYIDGLCFAQSLHRASGPSHSVQYAMNKVYSTMQAWSSPNRHSMSSQKLMLPVLQELEDSRHEPPPHFITPSAEWLRHFLDLPARMLV